MPVSNCMAAGTDDTDAQFVTSESGYKPYKKGDLIQFVTSIKGTVDKAVDGDN